MSSDDSTGQMSARVFLLGDATGADTAEVLARSLSEQGVSQSVIHGIRSLSGSALEAVNHEIATVADGFLHLDLRDVLMSCWSKYTELTKAAERTLASPGSEEVVVLATHRVVSTHRPSVDLLVDGVKVHTFVFVLKVVFDLNGVVTVLRQGGLAALRGGECVITATLTLEGTPLELSRKGRIDLGLVVSLHRPVPLVRQGRHRRELRLDLGQAS
jgi:cobalamin biosynthesis Co2+ chelatase CbiK